MWQRNAEVLTLLSRRRRFLDAEAALGPQRASTSSRAQSRRPAPRTRPRRIAPRSPLTLGGRRRRRHSLNTHLSGSAGARGGYRLRACCGGRDHFGPLLSSRKSARHYRSARNLAPHLGPPHSSVSITTFIICVGDLTRHRHSLSHCLDSQLVPRPLSPRLAASLCAAPLRRVGPPPLTSSWAPARRSCPPSPLRVAPSPLRAAPAARLAPSS